MSASETSTGGAFTSERRVGWRLATLPLESVIRWGQQRHLLAGCSLLVLWVVIGAFAWSVFFSGPFQISERVFTLETLQGRQVAHDEEVHQSGLDLRCVSAPDFSSAWRWRIRDGVLETRWTQELLPAGTGTRILMIVFYGSISANLYLAYYTFYNKDWIKLLPVWHNMDLFYWILGSLLSCAECWQFWNTLSLTEIYIKLGVENKSYAAANVMLQFWKK